MNLNVEDDKRAIQCTEMNTKLRQLYCQGAPLCDVKIQKMHKHGPRHAQAVGIKDTYTHTHLAAAQGW